MSDAINSTSFYMAIGKSRQVMLLISEPKKGQNIFLLRGILLYLAQRAMGFPVSVLSALKVTATLQCKQGIKL